VNDTQIDGSTADTIVFRNVYAAASTSVTLEATKELTGRDLVAGEFDFAIADNNGNVIAINIHIRCFIYSQ
ncbi:MAG: hypothetical protein J6V04_04805, partial [Bacteroidales bacterium]|nr:hypothetical protein [Bacteroidales bacterium]